MTSFSQYYRGRSPRYDVHREEKGRLKTGTTIFAETSAVIPAQAGIQKFEIAATLKCSRNAEVWIPAYAGMTAVG